MIQKIVALCAVWLTMTICSAANSPAVIQVHNQAPESYRVPNTYLDSYYQKHIETQKTVAQRLNRPIKSEQEYSNDMEVLRGQSAATTVILLHDKDQHIRMSIPLMGVDGIYTLDSTTGRARYRINLLEQYTFVLDADTQLQQSGLESTYIDDAFDERFQQIINENPRMPLKESKQESWSGAFTYPSIKHGMWQKRERSIWGVPIYEERIGFSLDSSTYRVGLIGMAKALSSNNARILLENVVPTVKDIRSVNRYSQVITYGHTMYRILNGSELVEMRQDGDTTFWIYQWGDIQETISITTHPSTLNGDYSFRKPLYGYFRMSDTPKIPENIGYAVVWNQGLPGYLIDSYDPKGASLMQFTGYDGHSLLVHTIRYNPSTSFYTHVELRDMIECFDSTNAGEFRYQTHRIFPMPKR